MSTETTPARAEAAGNSRNAACGWSAGSELFKKTNFAVTLAPHEVILSHSLPTSHAERGRGCQLPEKTFYGRII
jgi:hypothetical protein